MTRCPSPVDLERAYWSGKATDAPLRLHAANCNRCSEELAGIEALVAVGRTIEPAAITAARREELRTAILSRNQAAPTARRRAWWPVIPVAAAAAAVALWWLWPQGGASAAIRRSHVMVHAGAEYMIAGSQPDEIVRLVDGTLTVNVDPLERGERFRIITSDAEVEVIGTAFDVTAVGDRLVSVRVMHGAVDVRPSRGEPRRIRPGQTWQAAPDPTLNRPTPPPVDDRPAPPAAGDRPQPPAPQIQTAPPTRPAPPARGEAQRAFDDGWAALRANRFDDAATAFGKSAGLGGHVAEDATYWHAVALARAGHSARAARRFQSFLDIYRDSARAGEASAMLGWIQFEAGDHAEAARRFRRALEDPSARVRKSAVDGLEAIRKAQR